MKGIAMKTFIFALFLGCLLSSQVFSDDMGSALKSNMKQIGTLFKAVSISVNDHSMNQQNIIRTKQLIDLLKSCLNLVPDSINSLPENQRNDSISTYQKMITDEFDMANSLLLAFSNNDNATAGGIVMKMTSTKKEGHTRFDP